MKIIVFLLLFFSSSFLQGSQIEKFYKTAMHKRTYHHIAGIDYIYMINAKKDLGRFRDQKKEFDKYDICLYRFDAFDPNKFSYKILSNIGAKAKKGTEDFNAIELKKIGKNFSLLPSLMTDPNSVYFNKCMTMDFLSRNIDFLSIIYDAYKSKYKTAWIMEDNVKIRIDPNILTGHLIKLNEIHPKWDILYTDENEIGTINTIEEDLPWPYRPDVELNDLTKDIKKDDSGIFYQNIDYRTGAYSFILSRQGMKKILDYYHKNKFFIPFYMEVQRIPGINAYTVFEDVVANSS